MKFMQFMIIFEVGLIAGLLITFEFRYYQENHRFANPWRYIVEAQFDTYLCRHAQRVYFYGFPLLEVLDKAFFLRIRTFLNYGLCYEVSALMMLTFSDNRTARIVRAKIWDDAKKYWVDHSWFELRYRGVWFLIDPCWQFPYWVPREKFYALSHMKEYRVCERDEFMSYPISTQFAEKLRDPDTSCLLAELMLIYRPYPEDTIAMFSHYIEERRLGDLNGKIICPIQAVYSSKILCISKGIVRDYMSKEGRLQPKAKTLRRYYAACRHTTRYGYMDDIITPEQFEALSI